MKKIKSIKIIDSGSPPDIDTDFHTIGRGHVINYIIEKYGKNNVASIITPGPFKAKNAWKSMCTINNIPRYKADEISKLLPDSTDNTSISSMISQDGDNYENSYDLRNLITSKEIEDTLWAADKLKDRMRETGVHACGLIISNKRLDDTIPIQIRQDDNMPVTQWTYYDCEAIGLIKMDFLGLDTVDLIDNTLKNIEYTKGIKIDMEDLINGPLNDKKTFELFQKGDTEAIFQFSGAGVQELLRSVKPTEFEDLAAITALYRPGPMGLNLHLDYAERKNNPEARIPIHTSFIGTDVEKILEKTYASLCYQEQLIRISRQCADFTPQEGDKLRKAVGKKNEELLRSLEDKFKKGMLNNGYNPEGVNILWDGIVGFGKYAFNLSHSVSYALISYQSAYLKANYPVEFMAAVLQQRFNDNKISSLFNDVKRMNIKVTEPNVNESNLFISPNKNGKFITYGLSCIKGINENLMKTVIEERNKNGKYSSIFDFVKRNPNVKSGTFKQLSLAGVFDCFNIPRKELFEKADKIIQSVSKMDKYNSNNNLFGLFQQNRPLEETYVNFSDEEWSFSDKISKQAEVTGMYISAHPIEHIRQEQIDLNNISKSCSVYLSFAKVETKKARDKSTYYLVKADNNISQKELRFNKHLIARINKYNALIANKNDLDKAAESLNISDNDFEKWSKLKPLKLPDEHKAYKVVFGVRTFNRADKEIKNVYIEDIVDVELSHDGREYITLDSIILKAELIKKYMMYFNSNKGNDFIKVKFDNGKSLNIDKVNFIPGTTQQELVNIK